MVVPIAFQSTITMPVDAAEDRLVDALQQEGFGVLTRIDVQAILRNKLGEEFRPYRILGACNPLLAHRALSHEPLVGVMLPCNVTIEEVEGGSRVSIVNPEAMLGLGPLADNAAVRSVASEARARLESVARSLSA